jgi:hypothetical protein
MQRDLVNAVGLTVFVCLAAALASASIMSIARSRQLPLPILRVRRGF